MEKKNFLRATLLAATLVVAGYGGIKAYNYSYAKRVNSEDAMLIANIEALTQGEDIGAIDAYVNDLDIRQFTNYKTETMINEDSIEVTIHYSQTCISYYNYCRNTGYNGDRCYTALNGLSVTCGEWTNTNDD